MFLVLLNYCILCDLSKAQLPYARYMRSFYRVAVMDVPARQIFHFPTKNEKKKKKENTFLLPNQAGQSVKI